MGETAWGRQRGGVARRGEGDVAAFQRCTHPDGGLRLEVELVAGEARQEVGLPDAGVTDEHNCRRPRRAGKKRNEGTRGGSATAAVGGMSSGIRALGIRNGRAGAESRSAQCCRLSRWDMAAEGARAGRGGSGFGRVFWTCVFTSDLAIFITGAPSRPLLRFPPGSNPNLRGNNVTAGRACLLPTALHCM